MGENNEKEYIDENNQVKFDFSLAIDVFEPHELANRHSEYLSDVDYVIEDTEEVVFMEYKNSAIPGVVNPEAFNDKLRKEKFWNKIAQKFYGTLFLTMACDKNPNNKPIDYVFLMETNPVIDSVIRKKLEHKMISRLPFDYAQSEEVKREMIRKFKILDINQWNNEYSKFHVDYIDD